MSAAPGLPLYLRAVFLSSGSYEQKPFFQSEGLAVDMGAWREQTCHVGWGQGLAVVWQHKKQEHSSPVLTQQEGAGDREDTASGFPPPPAPMHDF